MPGSASAFHPHGTPLLRRPRTLPRGATRPRSTAFSRLVDAPMPRTQPSWSGTLRRGTTDSVQARVGLALSSVGLLRFPPDVDPSAPGGSSAPTGFPRPGLFHGLGFPGPGGAPQEPFPRGHGAARIRTWPHLPRKISSVPPQGRFRVPVSAGSRSSLRGTGDGAPSGGGCGPTSMDGAPPRLLSPFLLIRPEFPPSEAPSRIQRGRLPPSEVFPLADFPLAGRPSCSSNEPVHPISSSRPHRSSPIHLPPCL